MQQGSSKQQLANSCLKLWCEFQKPHTNRYSDLTELVYELVTGEPGVGIRQFTREAVRSLKLSRSER